MPIFNLRNRSAAIVAGAVMGVVSLFTAVDAAQAQALFQTLTGPDATANASRAAAAGTHKIRERLVRVDTNVLGRHMAPVGSDQAMDRQARAQMLDGVVRLDLFPDVAETFTRTAVKAGPSGGYIWQGEVQGKVVHEALLLINNGAITGRIQLAHRLFKIEHVSGQVHRIVEINANSFPPEAPPVSRPVNRSQLPPPAQPDMQVQKNPVPLTPKTITVLVAYTTLAATEAGGAANLLAEINTAVALANEAYGRAGVPITMTLATAPIPVAYAESASIDVDLDNLTNGTGVFAAIHTARDTNSADLVSLFRKDDATFCGIANFPGGGNMPMPSPATASTGYSVMNWQCVTNLSFHHEMGHNMGLRHDNYVDPTGKGSKNYNHGYSNFKAGMRTIMAYNNECLSKLPDPGCTRINWFSSKKIKATGKVKIGGGGQDNSRRLGETYVAISAYR
jgi:hypothetical protein